MLAFSSAPARQADIDGTYAWIRMAVCILLGTIGGVGMWSVVVILPGLQEEFGVQRGEASLPYASTMIGFALGNLVFGRMLDRHGTALPVALSGLLIAAGFILCAVTHSLVLFTLIHGLMIGLGSSATFAPLLADISHWFERRRGIAVAATACGSYLAGVVWPLAMQPLIEGLGWRLSYVVIGLICGVVIVPLAAILRRPSPRDGVQTPEGVRQVKPLLDAGMTPRQLQAVLVLAGVACCVAMAMPQIHIIAYCTDLGYGAARGAEMLALMMGAGIISRLLSGVLVDRLGGLRTLLLGSFGQMLALLLYMPVDGLASLYVVSLIFGLSQGGIVPCYTIVIREYLPAREAGERVGIVMMATILGMGLGGWMSGELYDLTGSYAAAFLNGSAWNLVNIALISLILFRSRRRLQPA